MNSVGAFDTPKDDNREGVQNTRIAQAPLPH
jgi:hypothetical protein